MEDVQIKVDVCPDFGVAGLMRLRRHDQSLIFGHDAGLRAELESGILMGGGFYRLYSS
jgi:hypothetical protein